MIYEDPYSIFLACNYNNRRIKRHFDKLKEEWEYHYPLRITLIDKIKRRGAADIWEEIISEIEIASLAVFDVSTFRPNVVIELGYALAIKDYSQIVICWDSRTVGGKKPDWLLSDISHLTRIQYKSFPKLDAQLADYRDSIPAMQRYIELADDVQQNTNAGEKYADCACEVVQWLLEGKPLSDKQVLSCIQGSSIQKKKFFTLLRKYQLAIRGQGQHGKWKLVEE